MSSIIDAQIGQASSCDFEPQTGLSLEELYRKHGITAKEVKRLTIRTPNGLPVWAIEGAAPTVTEDLANYYQEWLDACEVVEREPYDSDAYRDAADTLESYNTSAFSLDNKGELVLTFVESTGPALAFALVDSLADLLANPGKALFRRNMSRNDPLQIYPLVDYSPKDDAICWQLDYDRFAIDEMRRRFADYLTKANRYKETTVKHVVRWLHGEPESYDSVRQKKHKQAAAEADRHAERGNFGATSNTAALLLSKITNVDASDETALSGETICEPRSLAKIKADIWDRFRNFPAVLGGKLFVPNPKTRDIDFLNDPNELFSWFHDVNPGGVEWKRSPCGCVGKTELFHSLLRTGLRRYESVEKLPHFPEMSGCFYLRSTEPHVINADVKPGSTLERLLDRFKPNTDEDRQLIKALFATVLWGGSCGSRPAFLITAQTGRGSGKSKLAQMVAHFAGSHFEFGMHEDEATIKQRLLTPSAMSTRVAILDNVKTERFSWGALESLITSSKISGKQMYAGEAARPNNLIWLITLNGASLATDLAQRVVTIELTTPDRTPNWEAETRRFIDDHKHDLIADIWHFFESTPATLLDLSRWADWDSQVLARLKNPGDVKLLVDQRRESANVEDDEFGILEDYFAKQLQQLQYRPQTDRVFVPSDVAACWFNIATGERIKVVAACRRLTQAITEGSVKYLERNTDNRKGRGFIWVQPAASSLHVFVDIKERMRELREKRASTNEQRTDGGQMADRFK